MDISLMYDKKLGYTAEIACVVSHKAYIAEVHSSGYILVADIMGLASANWTQLALKFALLCEITHNDHWAIQAH